LLPKTFQKADSRCYLPKIKEKQAFNYENLRKIPRDAQPVFPEMPDISGIPSVYLDIHHQESK
jgi:hypothetical protein